MSWLSLIIWLPILGGVFVLLTCGSKRHPNFAKVLATLFSFASVLTLLPIFYGFDKVEVMMQMQELISIISPRYDVKGNLLDSTLPLTIFYYLGVDGLSIWFLFANTVISFLAILYSCQTINFRTSQYLACFLIMSGLLNGVFLAADGVLFFIFFEASFIAMYFLIGIWGGENRISASVKYIVFMVSGSIILLLALTYMFVQAGDFIIDYLPSTVGAQLNIPFDLTGWTFRGHIPSETIPLFLGFFIAFAIKIPLLPFHSWLPDTHSQAPTGASAVLAAIMLKLGIYGIIRIVLPVVPDGGKYFAPLIIGLALIAIIYFGIIIYRQTNIKRFIAYSSIIHMSIITIGVFVYNLSAFTGAVFHMFSHALIATGLFIAMGVLYERCKTYDIKNYGGIINVMPKLSIIFLILLLANIGIPITSGFVGEMLILIGAAEFNIGTAIIIGIGIFLSTINNLWLYKRVFLGKITNSQISIITDINTKELLVLTPIIILIIYFGLQPHSFFEFAQSSLQRMFYLINVSKL